MATTTVYPHLTMKEDGTARIGNTRCKVQHLAAEHYVYGWTYFYDHYDAMAVEIEESAERAECARSAQPLSREELLKRWAARGA